MLGNDIAGEVRAGAVSDTMCCAVAGDIGYTLIDERRSRWWLSHWKLGVQTLPRFGGVKRCQASVARVGLGDKVSF